MSEVDLLSRLIFSADEVAGNETVSLNGEVVGWIISDASRQFGWVFDFAVPHGQHGRLRKFDTRREARDYFRETAKA